MRHDKEYYRRQLVCNSTEGEVCHSGLVECVDTGTGPNQARASGQVRPTSGLASQEASLREEGFDEQAIGVILGDRADSTNHRYEWYWGRFTEFCAGRNISNPKMARIQDLVGFVDYMTREHGYAFSTTKMYVSAISFFL